MHPLELTLLLALYDLLSGGGGDVNDEDEESISTASASSSRRRVTASRTEATDTETVPSLSANTNQSASAHSAVLSKPKGKLRLSDISGSTPSAPQSISSISTEKVSKTRAKAKVKAEEAAARAAEKAAAKVAKAEEKAQKKAAKAASKGNGTVKRKVNPKFDSPEPNPPESDVARVPEQGGSNAHDGGGGDVTKIQQLQQPPQHTIPQGVITANGEPAQPLSVSEGVNTSPNEHDTLSAVPSQGVPMDTDELNGILPETALLSLSRTQGPSAAQSAGSTRRIDNDPTDAPAASALPPLSQVQSSSGGESTDVAMDISESASTPLLPSPLQVRSTSAGESTQCINNGPAGITSAEASPALSQVQSSSMHEDVAMDISESASTIRESVLPIPSLAQSSFPGESTQFILSGMVSLYTHESQLVGRPATPPPLDEHSSKYSSSVIIISYPKDLRAVLGKRANTVLTPIKSRKASGRIRHELNASDEENDNGQVAIEPIPPQPFSAFLHAAAPDTQPLARPLPSSAKEAVQPSAHHGTSPSTALVGTASLVSVLSGASNEQATSSAPSAKLRQGGLFSSSGIGALPATHPASRSQLLASAGTLSTTMQSLI